MEERNGKKKEIEKRKKRKKERKKKKKKKKKELWQIWHLEIFHITECFQIEKKGKFDMMSEIYLFQFKKKKKKKKKQHFCSKIKL